jgi:hypothetical protein
MVSRGFGSESHHGPALSCLAPCSDPARRRRIGDLGKPPAQRSDWHDAPLADLDTSELSCRQELVELGASYAGEAAGLRDVDGQGLRRVSGIHPSPHEQKWML